MNGSHISVKLREVKGAPWCILTCLALHVNGDGKTWVSQEIISEETGYSIQTVKKALALLEKLAYISIASSGDFVPNSYIINSGFFFSATAAERDPQGQKLTQGEKLAYGCRSRDVKQSEHQTDPDVHRDVHPDVHLDVHFWKQANFNAQLQNGQKTASKSGKKFGGDMGGEGRGGSIYITTTAGAATDVHKTEQLDEGFGEVATLFEANIGRLTPISAQQLGELCDEYSRDWVKAAIEEAVANNVRRLSYMKAILARWQAEGFKSGKPSGGGKRRPPKLPTAEELKTRTEMFMRGER